MTDRELMQQALHTLEGWANHGKWVWPESALEQAKRNTTESIAALRERLAQPEREPLTDEEIEDIWADCPADWDDKINVLTLARAIEQAHGIKGEA